MPEYYMPPNNPCPSCGKSHTFTEKDGAPADRDVSAEIKFQVRCPTTGATVEVTLPAEPIKEAPSADTGITCTTCLKSTYAVVGTRSAGAVMVQTLRCQNKGCEYEFQRMAPQ